jgi:hypothetical protein
MTCVKVDCHPHRPGAAADGEGQTGGIAILINCYWKGA